MHDIATPRVPVTTTYHGVSVTEDYRWLEDATSAQTREWTAAQNARTRTYLDELPAYDDIRRRVEQIVRAESVRWGGRTYGGEYAGPIRAGDLYVVLEQEPPKQQPFLVALTDLDDLSTARVVVDPNDLDPSGATTIDWYAPSPDGRLVAVSLSAHGSEQGTLHLFDLTSRELVDVQIARVHGGTALGSFAWAGDSSGFWYTRNAAPGERPDEDLGFFQEVWHHTVGDPLDRDRPDMPGPLADPKIVQHVLSSSPDGRWVMDRAQKGDGGEWQVFLRSQGAGDWWQVADVPDKCAGAVFGGDHLYLLSHADAPRGRLLRLPLTAGATVAQAQCIVDESASVIEAVAVTDDRLWIADLDGGPSTLRVGDLDGGNLTHVDLPPVSSVDSLGPVGPDEVVFAVESYTQPRVWWRARDGEVPRPTALVQQTSFDLSPFAVSRELATSADGTQVPMTVLAAPDVPRDGSAPAILFGYGGFAISLKPRFDPRWLVWLEQGGVLAVANLRGGGEYGETWHHAGRLTVKQNVFDDFIACAEHLVDAGITSRERLAIEGGSNGGLLVGAVMTQRPDLARVAVALVPVIDMLRAELHPNGAFVATEYGSVEDPEQFTALLAYSPYHNVRDGTAYPATLLTGGEFDPRVDAYHPKKMTARLHAATSSDEPILLHVRASGHGIGSSLDESVRDSTDIWAFVFDRLGVAYRGD
jgi:prolyl oligopeptidase